MRDFINQYYLQAAIIILMLAFYYKTTNHYSFIPADNQYRSFYVFNAYTGDITQFCKQDDDVAKKVTLEEIERQVKRDYLTLSEYKNIEFIFDRSGYNFNHKTVKNEKTNESYKRIIRCYEHE